MSAALAGFRPSSHHSSEHPAATTKIQLRILLSSDPLTLFLAQTRNRYLFLLFLLLLSSSIFAFQAFLFYDLNTIKAYFLGYLKS